MAISEETAATCAMTVVNSLAAICTALPELVYPINTLLNVMKTVEPNIERIDCINTLNTAVERGYLSKTTFNFYRTVNSNRYSSIGRPPNYWEEWTLIDDVRGGGGDVIDEGDGGGLVV